MVGWSWGRRVQDFFLEDDAEQILEWVRIKREIPL